MTEAQSQTAMAFYLKGMHPDQASTQALYDAFGVDFRDQPAATLTFLAQALDSKSADDVESMLAVCSRFGAITHDSVPLLCRLLLDGSHSRHEDIARDLQHLKDPRSIDPLYAACFLDLPYFWDDGDALARKCTWALHDIGTAEAFAALRRLTRHPRSSVVGYARKRLPPEER